MTEGENTVRLRKQATRCKFCASLSNNLRDQSIEQIQKKLLETRNITLEQALDKVRTWTANVQASDMSWKSSRQKDQGSRVNLVKSKQS